MEIKSIQTKKIYRNIVEQIVGLICEGSLKSGDKLPPERTLAEMFSVSRASLREALSVMEILGIVEIRPGDGSFVSDLNVKPFISLVFPLLLKEEDIEADLLELRKMLEISGVRMVMSNMKEEEIMIDKLGEIISQMEETTSDTDTATLSKLDIAFHSSIFALGKNSILVSVLDYITFILNKSVKINQSKVFGNKEIAEMLLKQHKDIYHAIKDRDKRLASDLMELHLNYVEKKLLNP